MPDGSVLLIITGGENVYSQQGDNLVSADRGVPQYAVFGRPDSRRSEAVPAVVVHAPGAALKGALVEPGA